MQQDSTNPELFGETAGLVDPAEFPSWIIFEDDNFLVLNKPGWLVCHPSKNGPYSSLAGAAREYLKTDALHLVNRLDRETSGVVVLAKNRETASAAQKAMMDKKLVGKKYIAILDGHLNANVVVSQPLADDKDSPVAVKSCCAVRKLSAKKAFTEFYPRALSQNPQFRKATLVEVKIGTGRKHQIRVHAQWIGHHVVGDKIYGEDENFYLQFIENGVTDEMLQTLQMRRQALHCLEMDFSKIFPNMVFKAPLKPDMLDFIESRFSSAALDWAKNL